MRYLENIGDILGRSDGVLVEQCVVDGVVLQSNNNIVVDSVFVQSIPNSV